MPASRQTKTLSVRIPEPELRRLKATAASRGVSVQSAVQEAIETWVTQPAQDSLAGLAKLQGSLAGVDVLGLMQRERQAELSRDRRRS